MLLGGYVSLSQYAFYLLTVLVLFFWFKISFERNEDALLAALNFALFRVQFERANDFRGSAICDHLPSLFISQ